ncbi:MAG: DUF481 domain-containing protein, partial [Candidatus Hydrogenedentes bacterium]|nr:DUF481 domain-containing protein [Candidatus Hydrogenedentota bacterium]
FRWAATRPLKQGTLSLRLNFDVPDTDTVGDVVQADLELLSRSPGQWTPFLRLTLGRDVYEALAWRTGLTVGVRHDFSAGDDAEFFGFVGLAGFYSHWRGRDTGKFGYQSRESEGAAALRVPLGMAYSQLVRGGGRWDSRLTLLPGVSSVSDFRAEAETALTYPLMPRLHLRLDMRVVFEEEPVFDTLDSVDTHLGASIRFDF